MRHEPTILQPDVVARKDATTSDQADAALDSMFAKKYTRMLRSRVQATVAFAKTSREEELALFHKESEELFANLLSTEIAASEQLFQLESALYAHNCLFDPTMWIILLLFIRGAFDYTTLEQLRDHDQTELTIKEHMLDEPLFLKITPGGRTLTTDVASAKSIGTSLGYWARKSGLPGGGQGTLRRDTGDHASTFAQQLGDRIARDRHMSTHVYLGFVVECLVLRHRRSLTPKDAGQIRQDHKAAKSAHPSVTRVQRQAVDDSLQENDQYKAHVSRISAAFEHYYKVFVYNLASSKVKNVASTRRSVENRYSQAKVGVNSLYSKATTIDDNEISFAPGFSNAEAKARGDTCIKAISDRDAFAKKFKRSALDKLEREATRALLVGGSASGTLAERKAALSSVQEPAPILEDALLLHTKTNSIADGVEVSLPHPLPDLDALPHPLPDPDESISPSDQAELKKLDATLAEYNSKAQRPTKDVVTRWMEVLANEPGLKPLSIHPRLNTELSPDSSTPDAEKIEVAIDDEVSQQPVEILENTLREFEVIQTNESQEQDRLAIPASDMRYYLMKEIYAPIEEEALLVKATAEDVETGQAQKIGQILCRECPGRSFPSQSRYNEHRASTHSQYMRCILQTKDGFSCDSCTFRNPKKDEVQADDIYITIEHFLSPQDKTL
ncbi:hypothetical protein DFH06DRAFT_1313286 [Mycena polygramma]|nr:hypothetical protein DFH06DRAFT_1313286 [Mycena polygramma]